MSKHLEKYLVIYIFEPNVTLFHKSEPFKYAFIKITLFFLMNWVFTLLIELLPHRGIIRALRQNP